MAFLKLVLLLLAVTAWTRTDAQRLQPPSEEDLRQRFHRIDTDNDHEISMNEFKIPEEIFNIYDLNSDGGIDELEFVITKQIDCEVFVSFDMFDTMAETDIPQEFDENGDGEVTPFVEMMKFMVSKWIPKEVLQVIEDVNETFDKFDTNTDGVITMDKAQDVPANIFQAIDANGDGYVTKIAMLRFILSYPEGFRQMHIDANAAFDEMKRNDPNAAFEEINTNGDDEITKIEMLDFISSINDSDKKKDDSDNNYDNGQEFSNNRPDIV